MRQRHNDLSEREREWSGDRESMHIERETMISEKERA